MILDDKAYKRQKKRVLALNQRWRDALGLTSWRVTFEWFREGIRKTDAQVNADEATLFACHARWEYLTATLDVNLPLVADATDDDLEWAFLHECAHVLVNETRQGGSASPEDDWLQHEERVCSVLAGVFRRCQAMGRRD